MTSVMQHNYDVYVNTLATGVIRAAQVRLLEDAGRLTLMALKYSPEYLAHPACFALDPVHAPLSGEPYHFPCNGDVPGVLDDYLPDDWGRRVLAHIAFYRDQIKLNKHSAVDMLSMLGNSRIGALQWVLEGEAPKYELGTSVESLRAAERAAQNVEQVGLSEETPDEVSLLYLANSGTGVGGARPKALIHVDGKPYLAKFNRIQSDAYNNARVELACIDMAKAAGIEINGGYIESGVNGREVLMLERFDVEGNTYQSRCHVISANSLLKDSTSQSDIGHAFRYDNIYQLIIKHSNYVQHDLDQLVTMMLFNRAIHNTDDHERNFSFIVSHDGVRLSPAYDMVPSVITGEYHKAGFGYQQNPPTPTEIKKIGRVFNLTSKHVARIADQVLDVVSCWKEYASARQVPEQQMANIQSYIKLIA